MLSINVNSFFCYCLDFGVSYKILCHFLVVLFIATFHISESVQPNFTFSAIYMNFIPNPFLFAKLCYPLGKYIYRKEYTSVKKRTPRCDENTSTPEPKKRKPPAGPMPVFSGGICSRTSMPPMVISEPFMK